MRKIMLPTLMLMLLMGIFNPARAQGDTTVWFWATTPDGLVAYTLDGQINPLSDDAALHDMPLGGIRLTVDTALFFDDENRVIYAVTPTTITPSAPLDEQFDAFRAMHYRHPYVVFTGVRPFPAAGVLNVETMEINPLTGFVLPNTPHIVFTDDTTLRYYSYADSAPGNDTSSTLWERNLATGEEIALLNFDYTSYRVFHSPDGQQWWITGRYNRETRMADEVTTYGEVNPDVTAAIQTHNTYLMYDWLVTIDTFCEVDCPVEITSLAGGEARTFTVSTNSPGQMPLIRASLADGTLLIYHVASETLYRLDPAGNLMALGQVDTMRMAPFVPPTGTQWVVALVGSDDESFTYRLWDLTTGEVVYESALEAFLSVIYTDDSVLISNGRSTSLYHADTMYDLSAHPGRFFQPLGNAQVLYEGSPDETRGVYVYDAPSDTLTLLVPDGRGIRLAELEPAD